MADQEPKEPEQGPRHEKPAGTSPNSKLTLVQICNDYIRKSIASAAASISSLGITAHVLLTLVAVILAAAVLFWIADKVVFFYLARSYVDQVADVFDLNEHLANALVLLTFIAAVFFGRYLWSLSRKRRLVGIAGISALLIGHSLVLWYGTRGVIVDRKGNSAKCYVLSRDGKVSYGEHPGVDPATGRQCRPVKPEMVERLRDYEAGKRPQRITDSNPAFFDPRSGEPIVWYYRSEDNKIEIFDLMGFEPDTGDELIPISKEVVEEWKNQNQQVPSAPQRIDPEKYTFFDPRTGAPRAWYWQGADGRYEFYDSPGFQPQTGDQLKVATRDVVDAWKKYEASRANAPQLIDPNTYPFFDPVTGAAQVWYWRGDNGTYEFYNAPGYEPRTGDKLAIVTREVVEKWKQDQHKGSPGSESGSSAPNNIDLQLRQKTLAFLGGLYREESSPNGEALAAANDYYADQINYFGKSYSHQQVMAELQGFYDRWPIRQYEMEQGSLEIDCQVKSLSCVAKGLLDFDARSPDRNQRSSGSATFAYVLSFVSPTSAPKIIQEFGDVKVRNLEPLSNSMPAPSGYQTWNGCPPNWTIQGGVCKPYQGGNAVTQQQSQQIIQGIIGGVLQHIGR